jgi:hypothetical protein
LARSTAAILAASDVGLAVVEASGEEVAAAAGATTGGTALTIVAADDGVDASAFEKRAREQTPGVTNSASTMAVVGRFRDSGAPMQRQAISPRAGSARASARFRPQKPNEV